MLSVTYMYDFPIEFSNEKPFIVIPLQNEVQGVKKIRISDYCTAFYTSLKCKK